MTCAAAILTLVGMAAVVRGNMCTPILSATSVALGSIMLAVMFIPGFSDYTAAAMTATLLMPLAGALALRSHRPKGNYERPLVGLAIVDIGFMSLAMLMMSGHGSVPGSTAIPSVASHHGSGVTQGSTMMTAAVLVAWTLCVLILVVPTIRRRRSKAHLHAICSGCMIAAMGVMAL